jgi:hypothetical protein
MKGPGPVGMRRHLRLAPDSFGRYLLAGVGFQDPQHFCDRLGVLMSAVTRRDDAFALSAVNV